LSEPPGRLFAQKT